MGHDALRPAMPSVQLALEHVKSDDYFQQLLSIDSALQAFRNVQADLAAQAQSHG